MQGEPPRALESGSLLLHLDEVEDDLRVLLGAQTHSRRCSVPNSENSPQHLQQQIASRISKGRAAWGALSACGNIETLAISRRLSSRLSFDPLRNLLERLQRARASRSSSRTMNMVSA